jgi:hypothetical protein
MAAGGAVSMAQSNVYSLNIVGYATITNATGFSMIANPLQSTNNNINQLFSDAPAFTKVVRFQGGGYVQYINDPDDGWTGPAGPGDVFALNPGEGVFVQVPSQYVKTFVGEVVLDSTNQIPASFSMRSSVVPQAGKVQTDLGFPAQNFDKIVRWSGTGYIQYILDPDDGWVGPLGIGDEPQVRVAEGFFVQNASPTKNWIRHFAVGP